MSRRHIAFPLGSEMWKKELSDHQRRLQTVKPTLPMTPSAPGSSRPGTNSGRGSTKRLTSPGGGTPSQRGGGAKGEAAPSATAAATTPASGLRIEDLNPSDQSTCKSMVDVLQRLSTAEGKTILEELFVAAEMKRLLSHYTGVYPTAASDENDEQESKKTSAKETNPKPSEPSAEPITTQSQETAHPLPLSSNNDKSGSVASSRKSSGNEETQRVGSPKTKEHSKRHHNHRHERGASSEDHTTPPPSGSAEVSHASEKHSVAVTGSSASVQSGSYRSEKAEDNSGREGGSLRRDGSSDHKGVAPPPPAAEKSETIDEEGAYEDEKFD